MWVFRPALSHLQPAASSTSPTGSRVGSFHPGFYGQSPGSSGAQPTSESEPCTGLLFVKVRAVVWVGVDLQASVDQMNASDANVEQLITCAFHAIWSCTLTPTLFRG